MEQEFRSVCHGKLHSFPKWSPTLPYVNCHVLPGTRYVLLPPEEPEVAVQIPPALVVYLGLNLAFS